jgi:Flp pilus assembly protein protease CpaA
MEYFLLVLALIWIIFATIQDLRKREIANWLNFSLIIFALGFRFFYSLFSLGEFNFFYQGLLGLGVFFILHNLLYYGKFFAGGDAKLFFALGAILPINDTFIVNLKLFLIFFFIFIFVAAVYSLLASLGISLKNFKKFRKEFSKQLKKHKDKIYPVLFLGLAFMIFGLTDSVFLFLGILIFGLPYLYLYAKSVDESCMIKSVKVSELTEGDWLYKDVKVSRGKIVKANWNGLTKEDIKLIKKKHKTIKIRYGIPFSPVFLISLILFILFKNWFVLWNTFL